MQLDAKTTALILIDLQRGVLAMPLAPHSAATVYERSMRLADRFRAASGLVVRVRVSFSRDLADAPRSPVDQPTNYGALPPGWDQFPEPPDPSDVVVTKRHWGAFAGTDLEQQLKTRGVDTVVLTGISTNHGVESTARQGTGLGFAFLLVEDACAGLDAGEHRFAFERIFPRLARIRATNEVIAALVR